MDVGRAATTLHRIACVGRATSGNDDRRPSALGVVEHAAQILRANIDMHQHRLRSAGCGVVSVGGRKRDDLEEAEHDTRRGPSLLLDLANGFLNGKRIRPGIQEETIDPLSDQGFDERFRRFSDFDLRDRSCQILGLTSRGHQRHSLRSSACTLVALFPEREPRVAALCLQDIQSLCHRKRHGNR